MLSVADPGCLSRILILFIPDPGSKNSTKRGEGKFFYCPTFFCSHKYHTIVNNFIFKQVKKIFLALTLRIIVSKNLSLSCQKYGFGIRDPRSWIQGQKGAGSRIRNTASVLMLCCAGQSAGQAAAPLPGSRDREQGSQASAPAQRGQKRAQKFHRWVKRFRLSWLANSALVYESKCGGRGGVAGSPPMSTAVDITWHGAEINFVHLTPYLTFGPYFRNSQERHSLKSLWNIDSRDCFSNRWMTGELPSLHIISTTVVDPHEFECGSGSITLGQCGSGSSLEEAFSSQQRTSCTFLFHEISLLFSIFVGHFALLDPNPDPADQNQCKSGSTSLITTNQSHSCLLINVIDIFRLGLRLCVVSWLYYSFSLLFRS